MGAFFCHYIFNNQMSVIKDYFSHMHVSYVKFYFTTGSSPSAVV